MDFTIVDAHSHLWLKQDTELNGLPVKSLQGGQSLFMGSIRQMMPPYMTDGCNNAEMFLANMNYARVSAAVVTQEYLDGDQNDYLQQVQEKYPNRFFCCGLVDVRKPNVFEQGKLLIERGFKAIKLPAEKMITSTKRYMLNTPELMQMYALMEQKGIILSIDLAEGNTQIAEMQEIIQSYPNLKVALGHFGMVNRPGWEHQLKLALNKNVMIESGGITWLFHNEFYPYKGAVEAIRKAADTVGIEKLMWGSDYPRTMVAITYTMSYNFLFGSKLLNDNELRLFLGQNAIDFYGLKNLEKLPYVKNMVED